MSFDCPNFVDKKFISVVKNPPVFSIALSVQTFMQNSDCFWTSQMETLEPKSAIKYEKRVIYPSTILNDIFCQMINF